MKNIRKLLFILVLGVLLIPNVVNAASGSLSVSGSSTGVVGNQLSVTVTLSSSTAIGSWEFDIGYDRSYLDLTSSSTESGGTHAVNYSGSGGIKSKSYTFKFKVKKSGSTTVRVSSSDVYAYSDESRMSMSNGSKTFTLKTQEEIEASYSKDAYLKGLTVGDYKISPEFNKETYNYEVEVENDVEKVAINASKNDANASVSGDGEKELKEGPNKFEIVVTAQKGNSLTYTVTINRKELDPIKVSLNNSDYTLVRRKDTLPDNLTGMAETTVNYNGEEIPALHSDITNYTVVGVKNENGDVYTYFFEDGKLTHPYIELSSNIKGIIPISIPVNDGFKNYKLKEIEIEGQKINVLALKDDSKFVIIAALDATTGDRNYYTYDLTTKTIMLYNNEIEDFYNAKLNLYRYIVLGCIAFMIILLLIILFRKPSGKKPKKEKENPELVEEIEIEEVEESEEEVEEKPKKKDKKKKKGLKDLLFESEETEEIPVQNEEPSGNTEKINNLLDRLESDKEEPKKKKDVGPKGKLVKDDTFIKTRKINFDELAEERYSEIEKEPELSKKELKKLAKEEKRRAKKEAREQKKLLNRDEF